LILPLIALGAVAAAALLWRSRRSFRPALVWTDEGVQYKCVRCAKWHVGIPNWNFGGPDMVTALSRRERATRVFREHDGMVVKDKGFFTLALLEMPVRGVADRFAWGVWVGLRSTDVNRFIDICNDSARVGGEVFEGRLGNAIPGYPDTFKLPVRLRIRPYPTRPLVEVEDASHPAARHQQDGIAPEELRLALTPLFAE
jgi:hypothetical protein